MRTIKFRAWERNLKEIIPVHNIDFAKRMINTDTAWRLFNEIDLMQFTGLQDKNGREIYEGDIVFTENYGEYPMVIKWDAKTASFYCHDKSGDEDDHLNMLAVTVVIGNIYENPELAE